MDNRLAEFTCSVRDRIPGILVYAKVWGSHSHNTALPSSDVDYLLVYAAALPDLLAIRSKPETVDGKKPDFQAHEARKFCELLLKGNPGIVECLFTERAQRFGTSWDDLRRERRRFLSRNTVKQYVGYARGQLQKLRAGTSLHTKGGKFCEKWAYHLIRLLWDAERIASGGEPVVWKEGDERNLLMNIRNGSVPQQDIEDLAAALMGKIESGLAGSPLPENGDEEFLNKWLLGLRGIQ